MSKQLLSYSDIDKHIGSSELNAPLFWYKGRLLRTCAPYVYPQFSDIIKLQISTIQSAVETELEFEFIGSDGYKHITPIYEHKVYKHRVRIQGLPLTQVKEMISEICKLNSELTQHGLVAKDVQESNMVRTIEGFKWVDYGALMENNYENSTTSFVLTCYLIRRYIFKSITCTGYETCLNDVKNDKDIPSSLAEEDYTLPSSWIKLSNFVMSIPVTLDKSHWSENYSNTMDIDHPESLGDKGINVAAILNELEFETVTDVACNKGYYSFLAAKKAKSVIGFDIIPACIDMATNFNKQFNLPVVFAVKTIEKIRDNLEFETDRYRSDLTMALAIVHHIKDVITPSDFVKTLLSISNEYILIEDIDQREIYEECFLKQGCELVKRIHSIPAPRTLSLYKKL